MPFINMLAYAVSLSMDAFAIAVMSGITVKDFKFRHAVKLGLFFGLFQFGMPVIGYWLGSGVKSLIESFDHWVAFALLAFIGGKMIFEALTDKGGDETSATAAERLSTGKVLVMAAATSIDALIVGVTIGIDGQSIWLPAAVIGVGCFIISLIGGLIGKTIGGERIGKWASVAGGLILIGLGVKTLLEHLL